MCVCVYTYDKYLIIYVVLIIVPIIMAPKSVPTTLSSTVMISTCEIARNSILIAEGWLAVHEADTRYQSEQHLSQEYRLWIDRDLISSLVNTLTVVLISTVKAYVCGHFDLTLEEPR